MTKKRRLSAVLLIILCTSFIMSNVLAAGSAPEYSTFEELSGKTISMLTGAPFEDMISSKVPDVGEFTYFASMPDMCLAVKTHKSDACFMNNAVAELAANRDEELALFPQSLGDTSFGIAFQKGDPDRDKWQEAYDTISEEEKDALWENGPELMRV